MLKVTSISAFYGTSQVLWAVSLFVEKGELVALIGSNGAGKTSVLKSIIGLLPPKQGAIEFMDVNINTKSPHEISRLGIKLVPERRRLFPYLTVFDNLYLGMHAEKPKDITERTKRFEYVYQWFPVLKERSKQMTVTLSGGEQQMLAIGRALISRPKLLILDEPTLGLSPKLVGTLYKIIEGLKQEGVTILLVEQNVRKALELADRAYLLETGRNSIEGNATSLLNNEHVKTVYIGM